MSRTIAGWIGQLQALPAVFSATPQGMPGGTVRVRAVVADLWELRFGARPRPGLLAAFDPGVLGDRERLRAVLAACHVLADPELEIGGPEGVERLLVQELASVAAVLGDRLLADDERREELARRVLRAADALPSDEDGSTFRARLAQIDSVERAAVVRAAAAREARAREVREAMARKAAEEAAAKITRE